MDNPGLRALCEKQVTAVCLCPSSFDIHPAFFIGVHPLFMPELVLLQQLAFKACFHLLKCFLARFPFIFCSLSAPRRAKAGRIANSPFPRLAPVCRRGGERQPWKFNSEFCQFYRPSSGQNRSCENPSSPVFPTLLQCTFQLNTLQSGNIFAGEALFLTLFFPVSLNGKPPQNVICSRVLLKSKRVHLIFLQCDGTFFLWLISKMPRLKMHSLSLFPSFPLPPLAYAHRLWLLTVLISPKCGNVSGIRDDLT